MSIKKYRYNGEHKFKIKNFNTSDKGKFNSREEAVEEFVSNLKEINKLQQKLYAARQEGVIFVFQAMDAAGKDGCIRTVFSTLTPHGVKEYCFKAPSAEELSHDYLWRFWPALPARGNISIFNRSYYEDVLIGKVHELYKNQIVPERMRNIDVIAKRYREINDFEKYLYNNATRVVKIFLNVSKDEQAKRFISRIDTPKKNWKVSAGDIAEREYWDEYQEAFESMVNETSSKKSPWYVVPADHKWYARLIVSRIVLETLKEMDPQFPDVDQVAMESMLENKEKLLNTLSKKDRAKLVSAINEQTSSIEETTDHESEDVDELLKMSESEETEELKKLDEHKDKKHKKKKHKKSKNKKKKKKDRKSDSSSIDVDGIMESLDASADNAFVDGTDVVVEAILQEEAERAEEKALEELNEMEAANNVEHTQHVGDLQKLLEQAKADDMIQVSTEDTQQDNMIVEIEEDIEKNAQSSDIKLKENVLPDVQLDNQEQTEFPKDGDKVDITQNAEIDSI